MATTAGQMILTASAPALAQWLPADGRYLSGYQQSIIPARLTTGVSRGWIRDYWRNNMAQCRTLGIGGWRIGLPLAPTRWHSWRTAVRIRWRQHLGSGSRSVRCPWISPIRR